MKLNKLLEEIINEKLSIEVGKKGGQIDLLNNPKNPIKLTKTEQPDHYNMLKQIARRYPEQWRNISNEYNPQTIDIVIDSGKILIYSEKGKLILNEPLRGLGMKGKK